MEQTGSVICLQTLSFPRSKHFNESKAEGNCELRGTDKAHGQKNIRARFFCSHIGILCLASFKYFLQIKKIGKKLN